MTRIGTWLAMISMAVTAVGAVAEASPGDDVLVELASVTLADDCPAPARPAGAKAAAAQPPRSLRHCQQTSMQLSLRLMASAKPATVRIKQVELLDAKGKLLQVLASREATEWTSKGYVPWNEKLASGQTLAASYALEAPNWDKVTGGRYNAVGKTFQLRVTVIVGNANRTVEKQSITPAILPPPVPT